MTRRIVIIGFGRIGRLLMRQLAVHGGFEVIFVSDKVDALENFAYLYNYDSSYGRPEYPMNVVSGTRVKVKDSEIDFHVQDSLETLFTSPGHIDLLIDCSGSEKNVREGRRLTEENKIGTYLCTLPLSEELDKVFIYGVNHTDYSEKTHKVLSVGSCDSNAISHFVKLIDEKLGISGGSILTLHPAMAYQSVQDRIIETQRGRHQKEDFMALGRAASTSLIPKGTTTLASVSSALEKNYEDTIMAMSYRVPTASVTSANLSLLTQKRIGNKEFREMIQSFVQGKPFLALEEEYLVSIDYLRTSFSATVDHKWTEAKPNGLVRLVLWYDNEWAYCRRIIDFLDFIYAPGKN